jgi:hypothetical protein
MCPIELLVSQRVMLQLNMPLSALKTVSMLPGCPSTSFLTASLMKITLEPQKNTPNLRNEPPMKLDQGKTTHFGTGKLPSPLTVTLQHGEEMGGSSCGMSRLGTQYVPSWKILDLAS